MVHSSDQGSMKYDATGKMEAQTSDSWFRLCEEIIVYLGIHRMEMNVTMVTVLEVHRSTHYEWNFTNVKNHMISRIIDFKKMTSFLKSVFKILPTSTTSHFIKKIAHIDVKSKSQKSIKKNQSFTRSSNPISKKVWSTWLRYIDQHVRIGISDI